MLAHFRLVKNAEDDGSGRWGCCPGPDFGDSALGVTDGEEKEEI